MTPARNNQLTRASSLIYSSLCFIHDLHNGVLEPDTIRGKGLDMSQYTRLFSTSRVPTARGCRIERYSGSSHIVVLRRGQFCKSESRLVYLGQVANREKREEILIRI